MSEAALLLLDVDGPLNPWKAKATRRPAGYTTHRLVPEGCNPRKPLRVWLRLDDGARLTVFAACHGFDLAWATTWGDEANRLIGPIIGLPRLPVVGMSRTSWKYGPVAEFAAGRPLAWLDDDFDVAAWTPVRDRFLRDRGEVPTLLHRVDPAVGITAADLDAVAAWRSRISTPVV